MDREIAKKLRTALAAALIGAALGALYSGGSADRSSACRVLYVSREEIAELEKAAVKKEGREKDGLFLGMPARAGELAAELPKSYGKGNIKVVFSDGPVYGEGVSSISAEIYGKAIEILKAEYEKK